MSGHAPALLASSSQPGGARTASTPFHLMAKPAGPFCNLDCTYCFYLSKTELYPGTALWRMEDGILESYVRQYLDAQPPGLAVTFTWQGGEPTLAGLEFFERVVALQQKFGGGRRIENALQTNGVLLDDRWGAFLARHRFLVGLSLDGPRPLHDRWRIDKGGRPTFTALMRGLDVLERHGVPFNTLTTVHRGNARRPLEVYEFLRDAGSQFMQFIPIVERATPSAAEGQSGDNGPALVTPWSVRPEEYGEFLCAIFDRWVRRDVGRIFVQQFDVALEAWCGMEPSLCVFRETCGRALVVEHNGDVYSCDHFVDPQHRVGNLAVTPLHELVDSPAQQRFGAAKQTDLAAECLECPVRFACTGDCPKHRFVASKDGSYRLSYLCPAYTRFFHHIDPCMRFMATQLALRRPPADVTQWVVQRDASTRARTVSRNSRCPCGSNKRFKNCCGRRRGGKASAPADDERRDSV